MKLTLNLFVLFLTVFCYSQKRYQSATVAFYNVENLYDTIVSCDKINGNLPIDDLNYHINVTNDSCIKNEDKIFKGVLNFENLKGRTSYRKHILNDDFTFSGAKLWDKKKFTEKINNLATVISEIGFETTKTPPAIIGLAEIENRQVLEALTSQTKLKSFNYGIVHFNSFDARGIDVALLYQKSRFKLLNSERLIVEIFSDEGFREYTRDILQVSGELDGELVYFFVNHWPSRRGGEAKSEPRRLKAAKVAKDAMDKIRKENPNAKIILMGDLNDDPINKSIKDVFNTVSKKEKIRAENYFNPMEQLHKKGVGTLAYNDAMNLFDQFLLSPALANPDSDLKGYTYFRANVYSPSYLVAQNGQYKGYPFRSFSGDNYTGGYSDHYPVYTILIKEIQ